MAALNATDEADRGTATEIESQSNPTPHPQFASLYRAKLKDRYFVIEKCCSLWILMFVAHFVIFLILLGGLLDHAVGVQHGFVPSILLIIYIMAQYIIYILALYSIYNCKIRFIYIGYIFCFINVILLPLYDISIALYFNAITGVAIAGLVFDIAFLTFALLIYRPVYLWAKYFTNGGTYNKNMKKPEMETKCIGLC